MSGPLPRITAVTVGLLAGGALVGAALGAGLLAVLGLLFDGPGGFPYVWEAFWVAGVVGALFGAVGLPLVAWGFLRHVPIGRVIAETGLGTILGGTIGLLASGLDPLLAAGGALAGFLIAAMQLRWRRRPAMRTPTAHDDAA